MTNIRSLNAERIRRHRDRRREGQGYFHFEHDEVDLLEKMKARGCLAEADEESSEAIALAIPRYIESLEKENDELWRLIENAT